VWIAVAFIRRNTLNCKIMSMSKQNDALVDFGLLLKMFSFIKTWKMFLTLWRLPGFRDFREKKT